MMNNLKTHLQMMNICSELLCSSNDPCCFFQQFTTTGGNRDERNLNNLQQLLSYVLLLLTSSGGSDGEDDENSEQDDDNNNTSTVFSMTELDFLHHLVKEFEKSDEMQTSKLCVLITGQSMNSIELLCSLLKYQTMIKKTIKYRNSIYSMKKNKTKLLSAKHLEMLEETSTFIEAQSKIERECSIMMETLEFEQQIYDTIQEFHNVETFEEANQLYHALFDRYDELSEYWNFTMKTPKVDKRNSPPTDKYYEQILRKCSQILLKTKGQIISELCGTTSTTTDSIVNLSLFQKNSKLHQQYLVILFRNLVLLWFMDWYVYSTLSCCSLMQIIPWIEKKWLMAILTLLGMVMGIPQHQYYYSSSSSNWYWGMVHFLIIKCFTIFMTYKTIEMPFDWLICKPYYKQQFKDDHDGRIEDDLSKIVDGIARVADLKNFNMVILFYCISVVIVM